MSLNVQERKLAQVDEYRRARMLIPTLDKHEAKHRGGGRRQGPRSAQKATKGKNFPQVELETVTTSHKFTWKVNVVGKKRETGGCLMFSSGSSHELGWAVGWVGGWVGGVGGWVVSSPASPRFSLFFSVKLTIDCDRKSNGPTPCKTAS